MRSGVSWPHFFVNNVVLRERGDGSRWFQDRFKSESVNDMAYFVTLLRYIHQNPTKAGMVSKVA